MPFGNYFKTTWRNILRHKLFSVINILGLAIGLAACILISLFIRDEVSYDDFWHNSERIYRIHMEFSLPGLDVIDMVWSPGPLAPAIIKDIPQIKHIARINRQHPKIARNENIRIEEINLVDPDIVNIFDFNILSGSLEKSLSDSSSIALNKSRAVSWFGKENPIDKILTIDFGPVKRDFKVAAIYEDIPMNSQVELTTMIAIDETEWEESGLFLGWYYTTVETYYMLDDASENQNVIRQLKGFIDRIFPLYGNISPDSNSSDMVKIAPVNISDLHLKTHSYGDPRPLGNQTVVSTFSAVAILIILIASVNFMNLSTAKASQRAKEVSLRKVLGASQKHLIIQFLGESIFLTLFALVIGLVFVELILPFYNQFLNKELFIDYASPDFLFIVLLALTTGLTSGIYPALILSKFRPAHTLRANNSAATNTSTKLRSALVIFQFSISIALFVATAIVFGQMNYAKNIDLGYNKENLLIINGLNRPELKNIVKTLEKEFRRIPEVTAVTMSEFEPARTGESVAALRSDTGEDLIVNAAYIGYEFFKTYEIPLLAGREYDLDRNDILPNEEEVKSGTNNRAPIILNQMAINSFGLGTPDEAIGKTLYANYGSSDDNLQLEYIVTGVIPNVYFYNLKRVLTPTAYYLEPNIQDIYSIRYTGNPSNVIPKIESLWKQETPNIPFNYDFISEMVENQYTSENKQMAMFAIFSALAIFIACLGLFGLAAFTAELRTKEIGIRKVMGASTKNIVHLLIWQFSKPVLIANIIAWPVAYFAMTRWLENFVYYIDNVIIIILCLIAGLTALVIAWATVAGNSYAVARQTPIKALRYE